MDEVIILVRGYSRSSRQVQFLARLSREGRLVTALMVDKGVPDWRTFVELWLGCLRRRYNILVSAPVQRELSNNE